MLSNYSKIHQLYHRDTARMMGETVVIQEKIDGSQISFGAVDIMLSVRSKNQDISQHETNMFTLAMENLKNIHESASLPDGYVFRGEYLSRPKHNVLDYDSVPAWNIIIYDIENKDGSNDYFHPETVREIAEEYGFQVVPTLWTGPYEDVTQELIDELLKNKSILGGQLIEGIVIKCYSRMDSNDKALMCKYVRPEFKEMHTGKRVNKLGIVEQIGNQLACKARFEKAVQHAKDDNKLLDDVCDIGILMRYLNEDFEEHVDEIKNMLYSNMKKSIIRVANRGFASWYKEKLTRAAMEAQKPVPNNPVSGLSLKLYKVGPTPENLK